MQYFEENKRLIEWNQTQSDYPRDSCVHRVFEALAEKNPDAIAVILPVEHVHGEEALRLTYGELNQRANLLASHLRRLGVTSETPVAIHMERSLETVVAMLGILKAGGAYVPLDPKYPKDRLIFMLEDAQASVLLTQSQLMECLPVFEKMQVMCLNRGWGAGEPPVTQHSSDSVKAGDLAYIIYTSGSTGHPKGVAVPHRGILRLVLGTDYARFDASRIFLQLAPISFDAATFEIWGALLSGARCVLFPGDGVPDPEALRSVIHDYHVTTLWLTASLFNVIIDESPQVLSGIDELLTGGEALSVSHIRKSLDLLPETQLINGYGPTENTTFTCCYRIPRILEDGLSSIPIGRPIANTKVYILDSKMRPVLIGGEGELYIGGEGLARGYFKQSELTDECFIPNPFLPEDSGERLYVTGDSVRYLPDGLIEFLGRKDEQVKIHGYRIELGEIETVLGKHDAVEKAVVVVREDKHQDKKIIAYLTSKGTNTSTPDNRKLQSWLLERLPEYMVPSFFVILDEIPLTVNGKVDRKALPEPVNKRPLLDQIYVPPKSRQEKLFVQVWTSLLNIDRVGINDNFFQIGGNSLLSLQAVARLRRDHGIALSIVKLFQYPTIRGLLKYLNGDIGKRALHEKVKARTRKRRSPGSAGQDSSGGIAIIGMDGRFPGAHNISQLWKNLCDGVESMTYFEKDQLHPSISPSLRDNPNYVRARGIIEDIDKFDAAFFGISPREAEMMDPQQRVFLEIAWGALENAGYDPRRYEGLIGLYAGMNNNTYFLNNVSKFPELIEKFGPFQTMLANEKDFLTTRVSYKLDLKGPSVNVYTACSTSLTAVCYAFEALMNHQCDMALAGGISIIVPQNSGYLYQEGAMLSPDGSCRPFDAEAKGTTFNNGAGLVVLKRLEDALKDRDSIYAVIRGTGLNNDGADKASFTAPSIDGQASVIAMAHAQAGVEPETISYVETHGTGTPLGDPIEIEGLTQAFQGKTSTKEYCGIGSVKSNFGHIVHAAGVAGLIKTTLALKYKMLPPSLHFKKENPKIDFAETPFYVVNRLTEWKRGKTPLRAGVSSFGVGGTNAHIVLEEAPLKKASTPSRPCQLMLLSAKTDAALGVMSTDLKEHLKTNPDLNLADVCHTLRLGRGVFAHRRYAVCDDVNDATRMLENPVVNKSGKRKVQSGEPEIVFMFPGQGAQYVNMGLNLYEHEPLFQKTVDQCAEILKPLLKTDLREVLYPDESGRKSAEASLRNTFFTQPALFSIEYALAKLWESWGIRPHGMIGHSIGEFTAACFSGVFSLEDALTLVATRARLMQELPGGDMLSVRMPAEGLEKQLPPSVSIAAINGPSLCVASGPSADISKIKEALEREGVICKTLHTSHAFHSPMMDAIIHPFEEACRKIHFYPPQIPFVSTVTADWITPEEATDPRYWAEHLRKPVRFAEGVRTLWENPDRVLLEVGPRVTAATLARQQAKDIKAQTVISSLSDTAEDHGEWRALLNAVGRLWLSGVNIDWDGFSGHENRQRVPLPSYPFERKSFWLEPSEELTLSGDRGEIPSPLKNEEHAEVNLAPGQQSLEEERMPVSRKLILIPLLKEVMEETSGVDFDDVEEMTFLEMGLDSLVLTQASLALKEKFKVNISFRQLIEDFPSFETLAEFFDAELPPEMFAPKKRVPGPAATLGMEKKSIQGRLPEEADVVERVINQQLQIMSRQLELLGQNGSVSEVQEMLTTLSAGERRDKPLQALTSTSSSQKLAESKRVLGPAVRLSKSSGEKLTTTQQAFLDALVKRYNTKTAKSKKSAQANRSHLADPRTVSGFRPILKEMVYPIVTVRSSGSKLWDLDGNEYVDITNGFGLNLLGWSPPFVTKAVTAQLEKGFEIGPQTPLAGKVAKLLCEFTGFDRVAFCNTGSEAVMAAIRLSRTVTGRKKIVIFSGAYHGIIDEVIVRASASSLRSLPAAPGILPSMLEHILVLDYGTPESLDIIRSQADDLAAVLIETVQSRRPDFQPRAFLKEVRKITECSGTALIFDEVVTGFRLHPGGAQAYFDIRADMATYGKIIGGGFPIGIIAGKKMYLDALDGGDWQFGDASFPEVGVTFFAGTFVRHPVTLAAAEAVLEHLKEKGPDLQINLGKRTEEFVSELNAWFEERNVPIKLPNCTSLFYLSYPQELFHGGLIYYLLREKGIHIWEGRPCFLTTAHSDSDIEFVTHAFKESVIELQEAGFLPETQTVGTGTAPSKKGNVPIEGAELGLDLYGDPCWYISDPDRTGKYLRVGVAPENQAGKQEALTSLMPVDFNPFTRGRLAMTAPATESQREIWSSVQMGDDANCAYNESLRLHLRGHLDISALSSSFQALVHRHESLHTTFNSDGSVLCVAESMNIDIPVIDLTALEKGERETRLAQILQNDVEQPFKLERGPLFRAQIVKIAEEEHIAVFCAHHIICDGLSWSVMLPELGDLYSALKRGVEVNLDDPDNYSDYAILQLQATQAAETEAAEGYWRKQFASGSPVLDLPTDSPRPPYRSYHGARSDYSMAPSIVKDLKQRGAKLGCTFVVTLLAAFKAYLYRLSGQEDLVVGLMAAGQSSAGYKKLIGHCVNLLPIRSHVDGGKSFKEYLQGFRSVMFDAFEHQRFTIGSLLKKMNFPRDPARPPLVSVTFNIDQVVEEVRMEGLEAEIFSNPRRFENFEIFLNAVEGKNNELILECSYNTDLFSAETIQRWMEGFEAFLSGIVGNPERLMGDLPIISEPETRRLLVDWNKNEMDYPDDLCIHQLIERQATKSPDKTAAVFKGEKLSYAKLNYRAERLAERLKGFGVGPGTLVGICLERSLDMLTGILAVLKAGGAYLPLDPDYPKERLNFMMDDSGIVVLLTQKALRGCLPTEGYQVVWMDDDEKTDPVNGLETQESVQAGPESLAYVIYTSGSTGKPKGVKVPHRQVINFLTAMSREPGLTTEDTLLAVTTLSFDIAVLELYLPLIVGAKVVIADRETAQDGALLIQTLKNSGATVMQATPSTWRLLLESGWTGCKGFKILCGGEALPHDLAKDLLQRSSELWNMYGPTETTVWSTCHRVRSVVGQIPIGRPIANTRVYILDKQMQPRPIGIPGELYIGGCGVTQGYLSRPSLTEERFVSNPFVMGDRLYKTGDRARWRADGTLECLGRFDNQVKLRGYRIELGEIEVLLAEFESTAQAAVVIREDRPGDRRLVAYVVPKSDQKFVVSEVRQYLRAKLPEYMIPQYFVALDVFPLTPAGKIDFKSLPGVSEVGPTEEGKYIQPVGETEKMLAEIWQEVLGLERVGANDDFFELGGHSILAAQVISRLMRERGIILPIRRLFETPVIARLAKEIEWPKISAEETFQIPRLGENERAVLALPQRRLWYLEQLIPDSAVYNLDAAFRLKGALDEHALEKTLDEIMKRHDMLRARFEWQENEPAPIISPHVNIGMRRVDFRNLPQEDRQKELERFLKIEGSRPFDLKQEPLVRAALIFLGEDEHALFFMAHHIVWDGWSFDIFLNELNLIYEAFSKGNPSPLPDLPVQYTDYAAWHVKWLQGERLEKQLAYWKKQLGGKIPVLELPTDYPRPAQMSYQGTREHLSLSQSLVESLAAVAHQEGATVYMILLAAFKALLYRYTGQRSIIVGTPIHGRIRGEVEDLIGFFVNTLVLRTDLSPEMSFRDLLCKVRKVCLEAYGHQDTPFELLIKALQPEHDMSRTPLYQTMFIYQNITNREPRMGDLSLTQIRTEISVVQTDLSLWVRETTEGMDGGIDYNTDLFDADTIVRFIEHFTIMLQGIVLNPDAKISNLPMLSAKEENQILIQWNTTASESPSDLCFHQLFERQAVKSPDRTAVVFEGAQLSYGELERRSNQLARYLRTQGVGPETLVGISIERSLDMMVGLLGILKAGGAYLPLDPQFPQERLAFMLQDADVSYLLTQSGFIDQLPEHRAQDILLDTHWEKIKKEPAEPLENLSKPEDLAYVIYTSGSTGKPKGVQVPHRAVSNFLKSMAEKPGIKKDDVLLAVTTLSFDIAVLELFLPLSVGANVHIASKEVASDGHALSERIQTTGATVMQATPSTWSLLLSAGWEGSDDFKILCGGEVLQNNLASDLLKRCGSLWNMYGPTETSVWSTCFQVLDGDAPVYIGKPISNTQIYLLDDHMQPVPIGVPGELYIGGAGVTRGYLNRPELSAERFLRNPFLDDPNARIYKTGDLARYRPDGNIKYLNRLDNQVKVRGFRIELGEIEAVLAQHDAVKQCVVIVCEEKVGDKRLIAYIVYHLELQATSSELRKFLRSSLPDYMLPAFYIDLGVFPLTPNGKVDRGALPSPFQEGDALSNDDFVPPETPMEQEIAEIWKVLLGVAQVGRFDNFFDLGGHSLLSIQAISKIEEKTGQRITPKSMIMDSLVQMADGLEPSEQAGFFKTPEGVQNSVSDHLN